MILTREDYKNIAAKIEKGVRYTKGDIEYEKDGEVLCIGYEYIVDGYFEEDTNAFIMTWDFFKADAESYTSDMSVESHMTDNNFSGEELYKFVA